VKKQNKNHDPIVVCTLCDSEMELLLGGFLHALFARDDTQFESNEEIDVVVPSAFACYWPQWVSARVSDLNTIPIYANTIPIYAANTIAKAYVRWPTNTCLPPFAHIARVE
jgi:hypothetical protein